jgi:hypothetical protein
MRVAVNPANPHDLPWSELHGAILYSFIRHHQNLEASAARAIELCEERAFPNDAALSRCHLGHVRAELGRAADGIALIRQGIEGWSK